MRAATVSSRQPTPKYSSTSTKNSDDTFVERLNGQFAFALWDGNRRRLLLVRDRAGILPLYWCRVAATQSSASGVVFASEIKPLFASGLVKAEADPDGLDELWTFWAPVAPRTVFRGIEQLRPGEMLILEGGKLTRRQYWHWEFPADGQSPARPVADVTRRS